MAAAVAVLGLIAFTGTTATQAKRIAVERDRANREAEISRETEEFLIGLFEVAAPSESRGNSVTAVELLEAGRQEIERDLADRPDIHSHLMNTVDQAYHQLGIERTEAEASDGE